MNPPQTELTGRHDLRPRIQHPDWSRLTQPKQLIAAGARPPFLGQPSRCQSHHDPQQWAKQIAERIPVRTCDPLETNQAFHNQSAFVQLGRISATSTEGSAIDVHIDHYPAAQLLIPFQGNGWWHCDGQVFENPAGDSVLYVPPSELRLTNTTTGGVSLSFSISDLLETAEVMSGSLGRAASSSHMHHTAIFRPSQLNWSQPDLNSLIDCIYNTLSAADHALHGGIDLSLLRFDDLLTRLTLLLLIPALRNSNGDTTEPDHSLADRSHLDQLVDWMDAHLEQPISLSDLEYQSDYSRRSLQYQFKQQFGCSPMRWLRQRRLERSLILLKQRQSGETIWTVA